MKTIPSRWHHVHDLRDCVDLARKLGFDPERRHDDERSCHVSTNGCFVGLDKRSGTLSVDCPRTNVCSFKGNG